MKYPDPHNQQLAYDLWEKAGRPEGRADEFWHEAQRKYGRFVFNIPFEEWTDTIFIRIYTIMATNEGALSQLERDLFMSGILREIWHAIVDLVVKDKYNHFSNPINYHEVVKILYPKDKKFWTNDNAALVKLVVKAAAPQITDIAFRNQKNWF